MDNMMRRYGFVWVLCFFVNAVLTIFSLGTQQIKVKLVAINVELNLILAYTTFNISQTLTLKFHKVCTTKNSFVS